MQGPLGQGSMQGPFQKLGRVRRLLGLVNQKIISSQVLANVGSMQECMIGLSLQDKGKCNGLSMCYLRSWMQELPGTFTGVPSKVPAHLPEHCQSTANTAVIFFAGAVTLSRHYLPVP